jgi:triphosphoribosyl-dephospho-CoA synthase
MPAQALLQTHEHRGLPSRSGTAIQGGMPPRYLARLAVQALVDEAELTPKPALVDLRGSGAHHDLSLPLLIRSAQTLEPHFLLMAEATHRQVSNLALRECLGLLGREAERAMMNSTGGVNTHRGAIWALGLLVAAASQDGDMRVEAICRRAALIAALPDSGAIPRPTNGARVAERYGAGGARCEARAGFPHLRNAGLPALRQGRRRGLGEPHARLDALLAIMTTLEDTCLLHRGGREALAAAQTGAARVLANGGSSTADGQEALQDLHESLMVLWSSPGGSADLLAATLFVDRIAKLEERSL